MRLSCAVIPLLFLALTMPGPLVAAKPKVQLHLDSSEADQALFILDKESRQQPVQPEDWQKLFATLPYQWLKAREASIGMPFTDEEFERFLVLPESIARRQEWGTTLASMKRADMTALGAGVLEWLPQGAQIHAKVFPLIKPLKNSFVWEKKGEGRAIFLALEPQSQEQFENTVAHECHHIGLSSLDAEQNKIQDPLPQNVRTAMTWMSAFGEGEAMLAAAGSVDRHPHWEDDAEIRGRWDSDMMHFNADVVSLTAFFTDILDGKLKGDEEIQKRAGPYWGTQGAWYTVGYEMAVLIEKADGRESLKQAMLDPRLLLVRYNEVAQRANAKGARLALWPPELIARLMAAQQRK